MGKPQSRPASTPCCYTIVHRPPFVPIALVQAMTAVSSPPPFFLRDPDHLLMPSIPNPTSTQALIACATRLHEVQTSAEFGVGISGDVTVDFGKVMNRMRRIRSTISEVRGGMHRRLVG